MTLVCRASAHFAKDRQASLLNGNLPLTQLGRRMSNRQYYQPILQISTLQVTLIRL